MKKFAKQRAGIRWILRPLGIFVCLATLLPLSRSNVWWVRIFDYPRVQISALGLSVFGTAFWARRKLRKFDRTLLKSVAAAIAWQLFRIHRFTRLAPKEVAKACEPRDERSVSLLISNVRMRNRQPGSLLKLIAQLQPKVILLLEPDKWWTEQLVSLDRDYPYSIKQPQNNTYGVLFFSKLPLVQPEVRFLVQQDVPSIRTRIVLPNGCEFLFYGMHPKPPGRENRDGDIRGTGPRDAELVVVANEVKDLNKPVVVAGDFNDVAWSHTTRRFRRIARVLDPRIGRGFYNTYNAEYPWLRFPLDHLFHSEHFALINFDLQSYIGSDHFPIFFALSLEPKAPRRQEPPQADADDHKEAREDLKNVST